MDKLTLSEFEAMDRIKIDSLISLLIKKDIIKKNEISEIINEKIDNLVDCESKIRIQLKLNKFVKSI